MCPNLAHKLRLRPIASRPIWRKEKKILFLPSSVLAAPDPSPSLPEPKTSVAKPSLEASPPPPTASTLMANFPVDPRPHVPFGFDLVNVHYVGPGDCSRVFLRAIPETNFENVTIASFFPKVDKRDFNILRRELSRELRIRYRIQPSAIGDAFICLKSPLDRQRFLDMQPIPFGEYHVHFQKHDQAANASSVDVDREVWLMLLCFPLDCRSFSVIARSIQVLLF